jgi:hypothetical protein
MLMHTDNMINQRLQVVFQEPLDDLLRAYAKISLLTSDDEGLSLTVSIAPS